MKNNENRNVLASGQSVKWFIALFHSAKFVEVFKISEFVSCTWACGGCLYLR